MYERLVAIEQVKKCVDNDNGRNRRDRRVMAHDLDSNVAVVREAVNEEALRIENRSTPPLRGGDYFTSRICPA